MRVKSLIFVFGIVFLFAIQLGSAFTIAPIDGTWSQTSLTYNSGTTYTVGISISITDQSVFYNSYNGQSYCIDIRANNDVFGSDCDLMGTVSSVSFSRSWTVPESAINKTLTFRFKIPSLSIDDVSDNTLTINQGAMGDLEGGMECGLASDCGTNGYVGLDYCSSGDVYSNYKTYSCLAGTCSSSTIPVKQQDCTYGCSNGACLPECNIASDCGTNGYFGESYCSGTAVYRDNITYSCSSGTCSNSVTSHLLQSCNSACSLGICVSTPSFDSAVARWWDTDLFVDYTNQQKIHPIFYPSDDVKNGTIKISGIQNADGQQVIIDILKSGVSISSETVTVASNTATGTWTIPKSAINTNTNWNTFTSKITLVNTPSITKTLSDWMNLSLYTQSIVCDITSTPPTMSWTSSSASIQQGNSYTATMSLSGINAASGTSMTLSVYNNAGSLVSSQTVQVSSSKTITAYNTFSGLSVGTHYFYYTLTGCNNPSQTAKSGTLTLTVTSSQACSLSCGDTICCVDAGETSISCPSDCGTPSPSFASASASWLKNGLTNTTDTILSGSINNNYQMKITGITNAEGSTVQFDVYEDDLINDDSIMIGSSGIVSSGQAIVDFSIDEASLLAIKEIGEPPYKLYFNARIGSVTGDFSSNQLTLYVSDPPAECTNVCGDGICCGLQGEVAGGCIADCGDLPMDISNAVGIWSTDNLSILDGTSATRTLSISGITHVPIGGAQIAINLWEEDSSLSEGYSDENTQTVYATVQSDGTAVATITIGNSDITLAGRDENVGTNKEPYEFYGIINYGGNEKVLDDILEVFVENTVTCINMNTCSDYTDATQCNEDWCAIANNTADINCSDPSTNCYCLWNATELTCGPKADITYIILPPGVSSIGSCTYNENMEADDCSDGFLSYSWTVLWEWGEGNQFTSAEYNALTDVNKATNYLFDGVYYRYDPERKSAKCILGQNTIPCPAQVQLSGFTWVNLVIALLIVALIYWLIKRDSKKAKNKKKISNSKKKRK